MIRVSPALTGFGETLPTTGAALRTTNPEKEAVLVPTVTITVAGPGATFGRTTATELGKVAAI
jgi:hypothetical protein